MKTEIGEYVVGAYLKIILKCDYVDYNVRPSAGGLEGLGELDVVGIDLKNKKIYLCEVTTYLRGVLYNDYKTTIKKIKEKYERQKSYAVKYLPKHFKKYYMFWSPIVPSGLVEKLKDVKLSGLEVIANKKYTEHVDALRVIAKKELKDFGNPFFRALQILEALRQK